MRTYASLILAAIILSFSTAYFALNIEKNHLASTEEIKKIATIKRDFTQFTRPLATLDLSAMYPARAFFELIRPAHSYSYEAYLSKSCSQTTERMSKLDFDKDKIWEDFRCQRIAKLPSLFFETPPFVHESGMSYAYLAFLSGLEAFIRPEWIVKNLSFFHAMELKFLPESHLDENSKLLTKLKKQDLEGIASGQLHILSDEYYLTKMPDAQNVMYQVFPSLQFENFFKDRSYFVRPSKAQEKCFYREEDQCFEKGSESVLAIFRQSSLLIFLSSTLVLFFITLLLFQKIKTQKLEEERKKHALRVLTHELRTPVTNLLLQTEAINKESDLIPASLLEEFLKMEGEVYRLKRLVEKSVSYLGANEGASLLNLRSTQGPSLNHLLQEMLEEYAERSVVYIPLKRDCPFSLDVYWLNVMIKNLVENALIHGRPPVTVKAEVEGSLLKIAVSDGGHGPYKKLEEMLKSERVEKGHAGLGLGLSIVQKVAMEMKGKLTYLNSPTTFILSIHMSTGKKYETHSDYRRR